jgi:Mor family transcriptional regulator
LQDISNSAEFTGGNHEELAIKYRLRARQIRRILNKKFGECLSFVE